MDPGLAQAIEIGGKLLPDLITSISALIAAGHSPDEAHAIVKNNITSRAEQYAREKAEDEERLTHKHHPLPATEPAPPAPEFEEP